MAYTQLWFCVQEYQTLSPEINGDKVFQGNHAKNPLKKQLQEICISNLSP